MSRNFGKWLSRKLYVLKNWYNIASDVASILKKTIPNIEVYVFGSVIENKISGASDVDILVVIPEDYDEFKTYLVLSKTLEDKLGSTAYTIDLHVIHRSRLTMPPYKWWLKKSRRIL